MSDTIQNKSNKPAEPDTADGMGLASSDLLPRLSIPRSHPKQWQVGDLAIHYLVMVLADDPRPPCKILMVTNIKSADGKIKCARLDAHEHCRQPPNQLMSLDEALVEYDRTSEDETVRTARINKAKLESLRDFIAPREWIEAQKYWAENPHHAPDDIDLMRSVVLGNR